jgi:hypothetical protein
LDQKDWFLRERCEHPFVELIEEFWDPGTVCTGRSRETIMQCITPHISTVPGNTR